ncbi:MAG TPA: FHA domain-containing protein [Pirellulales bacterium]|nr:FHA domain-containing protein [Pirellulales bacterium]
MRLRVYLPEGAREWESSVGLFRVGRAESCALRFEGQAAKYSSWEHAEFSVDDEGGAHVSDLGSSNGTYVDGLRIAEAKPLWIGAVVQIGTKGPKLEVLELTPPARPAIAVSVSGKRPAANWRQRGPLIGLAVALLVIVGFFPTRKGGNAQPRPDAVQPQPAPEELAENGGGQRKKPDPPPPPIVPPVKPPDEKPASITPPTPPPPVPDDPWKVAKEAGLPAYRLIAIEDPKTETTWPYAGAVIVAPQALLTTADVGVELATFQARGMSIKILRDSHDAGMPVDRVRIHAAFQTATREEQLYFDLAILSTKERLTGAAALASAAELAAIERGQPLACVAINHNGEPIDRFHQLQPEWQMGNALPVTRLPSGAGAPRVLPLRGAFSDKWLGSPIFSDQGHLVALYCEPAPDDGGLPGRAVHFAKLIEPQLIELGLSQPENPIWVAPVVPPEPPSKKEPAK